MAPGTVARAIMFAWQAQCVAGGVARPPGCSPRPVWTATPPRRVDDADLAHRGERVAAQHAAERGARRPRRRRSRSSACGPWAGSTTDCVATAPTPGRAQVQIEPTENQCDCTAAPSSPVSGSRATIEYVPCGRGMRCARICHCDSATDRGRACWSACATRRRASCARYGDVSPGAPRFAGTVLHACDDPGVPWHRIVRADGSLAKGERQRRAARGRGRPVPRRAGGHARRPAPRLAPAAESGPLRGRTRLSRRCGTSARSACAPGRAAST